MNLADIRKKAKQDQVKQPVPAQVAETEQQDFPDIPPEQPEQQEVEPAVWYRERQPAEEPPAAPQSRIVEPEPDTQWHRFDPMETLLAGREMIESVEEKDINSLPSVQYDTTEYVEFLYFKVASEKYAITIMEIKEIIKPREVTEVPRVPDFVPGVLSLRGVIIPVFDMVKRLGLPASGKASGKERIIVVRKGDDLCGVLVDEVVQVVKIAAASIEPPPAVLDGIDREFVNGIGRNDSQMLILLNMEKILDVTLF
jgi:purine-binding chemotaxis protein CheW